MGATEPLARTDIVSKVRILIPFTIVGVTLLVCLVPWSCSTIYALGRMDLEIYVRVVDDATQQPIRGARVALRPENWQLDKDVDFSPAATDNAGMVRFFRPRNSCEDIIRPFHRTVTLFDLTWAILSVSADDYRPVEELWLQKARFVHKARGSEGRPHQIEFTIPLQRVGRIE